MTKHGQLITWLEDAHAMEVGIISTLEKHITDAKGHPRVVSALKKHLQETKKHAKLVKAAMESLGGSEPVLREGVGKLVSLATGIVSSASSDTPVKNAISDLATEHLEIACYTSLVLTAKEIGETKIATTCTQILREEKAMAKALEKLLPEINAAYLKTLEDEIPDFKVNPIKKPRTRKRPAPLAKRARKAR